MQELTLEYEITSSGPGGAEYKVYFPTGSEVYYMISDRECMVLRRNREEVLEQYILEDLSRQNLQLDSIRLIRR